jgi:hypothetical protein
MKVGARLGLALACVALVGVFARSGIGEAILARGDDAARAGRLTAAATYYDRARVIAGDSIDQIERYALLALLAPRGKVSGSARQSADAFVEANAHNPEGYFDRGLIEWRDGSYAASARDFGTASTIGHDPRAAAFAHAALRRVLRTVKP